MEVEHGSAKSLDLFQMTLKSGGHFYLKTCLEVDVYVYIYHVSQVQVPAASTHHKPFMLGVKLLRGLSTSTE
jgi:hypothetical protein